jgi:hypothetical protein
MPISHNLEEQSSVIVQLLCPIAMLTISRSYFLLLTSLTASHADLRCPHFTNVHWGFFQDFGASTTVDSEPKSRLERPTMPG